jgi:O-antigen/teichoic acid export membrane protein
MKSKTNSFVSSCCCFIRLPPFTLFGSPIASDFISKVAETFLTRVLLIGVGLITSVIVARILGPDGRGLYAAAAVVGSIGVQFGNLGLHASNTYYASKDRRLLPKIVGNTLLVSFVFGGLCAALAWVIFLLFPTLAPLKGILLVLALTWVPFGLAYMLMQNLLLAVQEVRAYNKIQLLSKILGLGLICLIIVLGAVTVETIFSTGLIVLAIGGIWMLFRLSSYLDRPPTLSLPLFKENIRYGLKAYLAAFFGFMVLKVDLLMVKYILGEEQTGYYSIAVSMADMIYMLPMVIGTILFPKLCAMSDRNEKWINARKVFCVTGIVMVIWVSFAALVAGPVVQFLFGTAFAQAVPAFIWLMPAIFALSVNTILMNYFASIGMPPITVYSPMIALALNIILNINIIPLYGIVGAAISSIVSYTLMLCTSLVYISLVQKNRIIF